MAEKKESIRIKKKQYVAQKGDIVAIKIRASKFLLAKVAFVSEYHKGVLLFRVYDTLIETEDVPVPLPAEYRCQFRSFSKYVQSGKWPVVGFDPKTKGDKKASRYVTASGLFEEDRRLRDVRASDRETIFPMIVHSDRSAEKMLREQFGV